MEPPQIAQEVLAARLRQAARAEKRRRGNDPKPNNVKPAEPARITKESPKPPTQSPEKGFRAEQLRYLRVLGAAVTAENSMNNQAAKVETTEQLLENSYWQHRQAEALFLELKGKKKSTLADLRKLGLRGRDWTEALKAVTQVFKDRISDQWSVMKKLEREADDATFILKTATETLRRRREEFERADAALRRLEADQEIQPILGALDPRRWPRRPRQTA
jgi:hypothetical protein